MIRWLKKKIYAEINARIPREKLLATALHGDNAAALAAIAELKQRLHFQDGSLQGQNFAGAQLSRVELAKARLQLVDFTGAVLAGCYFGETDLSKARLLKADLTGGNLRDINLSDADLTGAILRGVHLAKANLRGANLRSTDLTGANLWGAHLHAANLTGALLIGVNLSGAQFDVSTVLPDGETWHPDIDMHVYTQAAGAA